MITSAAIKKTTAPEAAYPASEQIAAPKFLETGFGSTTYGSIGYRRVSPSTEEPLTQDRDLQARLSMLCEKLRAKY